MGSGGRCEGTHVRVWLWGKDTRDVAAVQDWSAEVVAGASCWGLSEAHKKVPLAAGWRPPPSAMAVARGREVKPSGKMGASVQTRKFDAGRRKRVTGQIATLFRLGLCQNCPKQTEERPKTASETGARMRSSSV